jgi:N-acetylglucosaminyl-diphospho-decaprenol L-rhamnosyltransferase
MNARWAAVVLNFNSADYTIGCVESILADTSAGEPEVVVVDNGSHDDSVAQIRKVFPDMLIVECGKNGGYARGANIGLGATRAPIVAMFNCDLTFAPGTARPLVERLEREPDIAVIGPKIRNLDGSVYPSARQIPSTFVAVGHGLLGLWWPTNPFTVRYRQLDLDPSVGRDVDWLSGSAMWQRRAALDAIGAWDDRYFMYMEDVDLCWRLRRAGWRVVYDPDSEIVHVQGAVTRKHPYRMLLEHHRSAWLFARRRFTGARAVFLPGAAVYLSFRAALAMAEHAWHASGRPRARG